MRAEKSARTSLEEKTGAAPSVAKLAIDANGGRGELRALGGGKHDEWNQRLTAQLAGSLPEARGSMTAATIEGSLGAALTRQIKGPTRADDKITAGKANLVRAAFQAGVKPRSIARQFGLTYDTVREILG